jgi:ATP-dependent DNA helicase Rep
LRLIVNPDDDNAFWRAIKTPNRGIDIITLEKLSDYAKERNLNMFTASFETGFCSILHKRELRNLQKFTYFISKLNEYIITSEPLEILNTVIEEIDYEQWLRDNSNSIKHFENQWKNVQDLLTWMKYLITKHLENGNEEQNLETLLNKMMILDILKRQKENEETDKISLMTLHAAKGLEFPHVFLVGMEEDILPHINSKGNDENIQEERRLAYVGITRAQKTLTFSRAIKRSSYGDKKSPNISRFLEELPKPPDLANIGKHFTIPKELAKKRSKASIAIMRKKLNS